MTRVAEKKSIQVLTGKETRHWHSPFSRTLRELRQAWMLHRCTERARRKGYSEFELYDAFENRVASGSIEL